MRFELNGARYEVLPIIIGDGTVMTFGPGDAFLAEDITGQEHTATPHNWVRAYVDLDGA